MGIAAIIIGVLAFLGYVLTAIPFFGVAIDVVNIPVAILGVILGALGIGFHSHVTLAVIGLVLSGIAVVGGLSRLSTTFGRMGGARPI